MSRTRLFLPVFLCLLTRAPCSLQAEGPATLPIEGYTDRRSYAPGDTIRFHVSSAFAKYHVDVVRIGAEKDFVLRRDVEGGRLLEVPEDASPHGCRWPAAFTHVVPPEWRSGYYEVFTGAEPPGDPGGWVEGGRMWFVVRSSDPGKEASILLQLTTNTYNAYCNWGGQSLYAYNSENGDAARQVSFLRPIESGFNEWEGHFVRWAEAEGYRIEYAVNADLEERPDLVSRYRLVVSVGHDEYWSAGMRQALETHLSNGGNVAFLSGNVCCWQVRFEGQDVLVGYKQAFKEDPLYSSGPRDRVTTVWSHPVVGLPENTLTGVGMQFGGFHRSNGVLLDGSGAFTVHHPEHWIYEGTGLAEGELFGGKSTIVGYECDGCEFVVENGRPVPTHRDGTPATFVILASAPAAWAPQEWAWWEGWDPKRQGAACLGLHTRPGGGTVFTTGTTDWAHGLRDGDPAVVRITRNVLDRLSRR